MGDEQAPLRRLSALVRQFVSTFQCPSIVGCVDGNPCPSCNGDGQDGLPCAWCGWQKHGSWFGATYTHHEKAIAARDEESVPNRRETVT